MRRLTLQLLVVLSVLLHGGTLRACHVRQLLLGEHESAEATNNAVMDAGEPSDSHGQCACELRKGLAQPERPHFDAATFSLDVVCEVTHTEIAPFSAPAEQNAVPLSPDVGDRLPLRF